MDTFPWIRIPNFKKKRRRSRIRNKSFRIHNTAVSLYTIQYTYLPYLAQVGEDLSIIVVGT